MTDVTASKTASHYWQHLGLDGDPFAAGFKSGYFYGGAMRRQLLDQLVHFSRFSDQVILLTGATGCGSSTLLNQALSQLQEIMDCCYINGDVAPSPEQILTSLNDQLQLYIEPPITSAGFLDALLAVSTLDGEPEPILLAVDQAEYLGLESYQLLRELVQGANGVIRLLFVGEYQIEQLVTLACFGADSTMTLELKPLTASEATDYLTGVLQSAGYVGELPLSTDQLAVLHEQSGGNLAEINRLAPALLTARNKLAASRFRFGIPIAHVAAIGLLAVALVASWFYQSPDENIEDIVASVSVEQDKQEHVPALVLSDEMASTNSTGMVAREQEPVASAGDVVDGAGKHNSTPPVIALEQPAIEKKEVVTNPVATNDQPEEKLAELVSKEAAAKTVVESAPKAKAKLQKKERVVPKKTVARPAPKPTVSSIPVREQRLLEVPESAWVLQLMGAVDEKRTRQFVKRYVGRLPVTYFETRLKSKPWFVAVVGPYDDKEAAIAARKVLPSELQKLRPWARTIESVNADIRANRL